MRPSEPFCLDLTVTCRFFGSFVSYFGLMVRSGKFSEGEKSSRNFHLKDDFLILVSIKWWRHRTIFEQT